MLCGPGRSSQEGTRQSLDTSVRALEQHFSEAILLKSASSFALPPARKTLNFAAGAAIKQRGQRQPCESTHRDLEAQLSGSTVIV